MNQARVRMLDRYAREVYDKKNNDVKEEEEEEEKRPRGGKQAGEVGGGESLLGAIRAGPDRRVRPVLE